MGSIPVMRIVDWTNETIGPMSIFMLCAQAFAPKKLCNCSAIAPVFIHVRRLEPSRLEKQHESHRINDNLDSTRLGLRDKPRR
jgi:hypothetical protein